MGGGEAAWLPVSLVVTDLGSPCLLLSPVLLLLLSAPRLRLLAVPLGQVLAEKGSQFLSKLFDFKNPASVTRQPLQVPFDQTVCDFCDQQRTGSIVALMIGVRLCFSCRALHSWRGAVVSRNKSPANNIFLIIRHPS